LLARLATPALVAALAEAAGDASALPTAVALVGGGTLPLRVPVTCGPLRGFFLLLSGSVLLQPSAEGGAAPPGAEGEAVAPEAAELAAERAAAVAARATVSPAEFERLGGRDGSRNWRRSLHVQFSNGRNVPVGGWMAERLAACAAARGPQPPPPPSLDPPYPAAGTTLSRAYASGLALAAGATLPAAYAAPRAAPKPAAPKPPRLTPVPGAAGGWAPAPGPPAPPAGALPPLPPRVTVSCGTLWGHYLPAERVVLLFSGGTQPPRLTPAEFEARAERAAGAESWLRSICVTDEAARGRRMGLGAWLARFQPPPAAPRGRPPPAPPAPLACVPIVCGAARGVYMAGEGVVELEAEAAGGGARRISLSDFEMLGGRGEGEVESWRRNVFVFNPPARSVALGVWLAANAPRPAAEPAAKRPRSASAQPAERELPT